jgi:hypothetical protein
MKMQAACFSETLVYIQWTTGHYIPGDITELYVCVLQDKPSHLIVTHCVHVGHISHERELQESHRDSKTAIKSTA